MRGLDDLDSLSCSPGCGPYPLRTMTIPAVNPAAKHLERSFCHGRRSLARADQKNPPNPRQVVLFGVGRQ